MFGPPEDKEGQCNARLFLGDDYGDNTCTFRCPLPEGHDGKHQEKFDQYGGLVSITWVTDERYVCPKHGIQSGSHCEVCEKEKDVWQSDHECPECYGCADRCAACQNTGYNIEKYPELVKAALANGVTIFEDFEKLFSLA